MLLCCWTSLDEARNFTSRASLRPARDFRVFADRRFHFKREPRTKQDSFIVHGCSSRENRRIGTLRAELEQNREGETTLSRLTKISSRIIFIFRDNLRDTWSARKDERKGRLDIWSRLRIDVYQSSLESYNRRSVKQNVSDNRQVHLPNKADRDKKEGPLFTLRNRSRCQGIIIGGTRSAWTENKSRTIGEEAREKNNETRFD